MAWLIFEIRFLHSGPGLESQVLDIGNFLMAEQVYRNPSGAQSPERGI